MFSNTYVALWLVGKKCDPSKTNNSAPDIISRNVIVNSCYYWYYWFYFILAAE